MKFRRFLSIEIVLFNAGVCVLWWAVLMGRQERTKALIVLLLLQLAANFAVVGIIRKLRISGLTVIYVIGLLYVLLQTLHDHDWWMLCWVPFSIGLIWWSVKIHRRSQVR